MGAGAVIGDLRVNLTAATAEFERKLKKARRSLSRFQRTGESLAAGGAALAGVSRIFIGVGRAAGDASRALSAGMANVATLIPANTARVSALKEQVQALSVAHGKQSQDLVGGLYQTISAFGDRAGRTMEILRINSEAATAGVATTEQALALTSAVTKAYGDTSAAAVRHAADLALTTVRLGQTDFPQLAAAIGKTTPLAAKLGVTQEELAASFATLTGVSVPDDTVEIGYADHPTHNDPRDPSPLAWAPVAMAALESASATAAGDLEGVLPEGDVVVGDHWNVDGVTWGRGVPGLLEVTGLAGGRVTLRPVSVTAVGAGGVRWARVGVLRRRRYRVTSIEPAAGVDGPRTVAVSGHDLMGELAAARIDPAPALGLRGDELARAVLAAAPVHDDRLLDVAADRDVQTLPLALTGGGAALRLLAAATRSAWGRCYLRGDARRGERLVWESRQRRQRPPETIHEPARWTRADVRRARDDVAAVRVGIVPRTVDAAAATVLCDLDRPVEVDAGETLDFETPFRDPADAGRDVTGVDMQAPAPDTHYRAVAVDGGADRTADLAVSVAWGASGGHWRVVNQGRAAVRLTRLRGVGRGVYAGERQHVEARAETPRSTATTPWWTLDAPLRSRLDRTARLAYHPPTPGGRGREVTVDLEWQPSAAVAGALAAVLVRPARTCRGSPGPSGATSWRGRPPARRPRPSSVPTSGRRPPGTARAAGST